MLKYKLKKIPKKKLIVWSTLIMIFFISLGSIVGFYAAVFNGENESGIEGNTVYVNDLDADWNYYMGLNYTEIQDKTTLPGKESTGKYNDKSLIPVQITYNGQDIHNTNIVGYVSNAERQSKYVYYKYYPVYSDDNTVNPNGNSGYIEIELIDNPFTLRPYMTSINDDGEEEQVIAGFNSWVCNENGSNVDCDDVKFYYDSNYYLRSVRIPIDKIGVDANNKKNVILNLNADWMVARHGTASDSINSNNLTTGMVNIPYTSGNVVVNKCNDPVFEQGTYDYYVLRTIDRGESFPAEVYYSTGFSANYNESALGKVGTSQECKEDKCNYLTKIDYANVSATSGDFYYDFYYNNDDDGEYNFRKIVATCTSYTNVTLSDIQTTDWFSEGYKLTGYYYSASVSGDNDLYYNGDGQRCDLVSCGNTTYKLVQDSDAYSVLTYEYVEHENEPLYVRVNGEIIRYKKVTNDLSKYRYLSTRDTNLVYYTGNGLSFDDLAIGIPFTLTGNGTATGTISGSGLTANSDFGVDSVNVIGPNVSSSASNANGIRNYVLTTNNKNVKIGRNVIPNSGDFVFNMITGTANGKMIIESGYYLVLRALGGTGTSNANSRAIYGSDYDRVNLIADEFGTIGSDNTNLIVEYQAMASDQGSHNITNSSIIPVSQVIVKSGVFGNYLIYGDGDAYYYEQGWNSDGTDSFYTYGIYAGSLHDGASDGFRTLKVEGGRIFSINGGPSVSSNPGNSVATYITGGYIENVVGGAGLSPTSGNRIISVTGGNVVNSVAGGSNSYTGGDEDGTLQGNTLVYIGGDAEIGGKNLTKYETNDGINSLYGISKVGSVFGAGIGNEGGDDTGQVYNSHVIINGGIIYGDVYGGGNYGTVGVINDTSTSVTDVDIITGDIRGSVYGGANNRGAGSNSIINITCAYDRCLTQDYYVYVNTADYNRSIPNGYYYVKAINYWIRYGYELRGPTNNTTCDNDNRNSCRYYKLVPAGSEYDADAEYYIYNTGDTDLSKVNDPSTIENNVTDGEEDDDSTATGYYHTIYVDMLSGEVGESIYGGSNYEGNVYADVYVTLKGGTVGEAAFGGGRGNLTNVYGFTNVVTDVEDNTKLQIKDVYGGSAYGSVNNINATKTAKSIVTINGGTISGAVYGGGMGSLNNGAVQYTPYTYGNINVTVNKGNINQVFGGNNVTGIYTNKSTVKINGGRINQVFGGSNGTNAGINNTYVTINDGTFIDGVYGGGYAATTENDTLVDVNGGDFVSNQASVFGGGMSAAVYNATVVNINDGASVYNVYGGSNLSGDVTDATVNNIGGTVACNTYGGGFQAFTTTTHNNLNGTIYTTQITENDALTEEQNAEFSYSNTCGNAFGGGARADVTNANITLNGSKLVNVYGGSNIEGFVTNANVDILKGNIYNVFGGNNEGGSTYNTYVDIKGDDDLSVRTVFGGSNGLGAKINGTTRVNLYSGTVTRDIYGGGNRAPVLANKGSETGLGNDVNASITVNVLDGSVRRVFGGGNRAHVGDALTLESPNGGGTGDFNPQTDVNSSLTGSTLVNIVSGEVQSNVYGSGNASFVYGNTQVNIGAAAADVLSEVDYLETNDFGTNLNIGGSIFGGSETNTSDTEQYTYSSIGVAGFAEINIDGTGYISNNSLPTLSFGGSVFGSGNNSATLSNNGGVYNDSDSSRINITNFGTASYPNLIYSIQRASNVYVTDSYFELYGVRNKASTSTTKYALSSIYNFYILGSAADKGSHLYFNKGTSYLWAIYSGSMSDGSFKKQTVSDNGDGTWTVANSNNRIYMKSGEVLSITQDEVASFDKKTTTAGKVTGMTYLGMYTGRQGPEDPFVMGYYAHNLTHGNNFTGTDPFTSADYTYVYGASRQNENVAWTEQIKEDGYYTHKLDDSNKITFEYVSVTPKLDTSYYRWVIGKPPAKIVVDLKANKYSNSSTASAVVNLSELVAFSLDENSEITEEDLETYNWKDVRMEVLDVDTENFAASGMESTVEFDGILKDSAQIPVVSTTYEDYDGVKVTHANMHFGLVMSAGSSGWKDNFETDILDNTLAGSEDFCVGDYYEDGISHGDCKNDNIYMFDSSNTSRTLSFTLNHSKNLDLSFIKSKSDDELSISMGKVTMEVVFYDDTPLISQAAAVPVTIEINLSLEDGDMDTYGALISPGKKYEIFPNQTPTISSNGVFSIYQALSLDLSQRMVADKSKEWGVNVIYNKENYRYLTSSWKLPANTSITMIDIKNNEQYYYVVPENSNPRNVGLGFQYLLSDFIKMGVAQDAPNVDNYKYDNNMYDPDNGVDIDDLKYYYQEDNDEDGRGTAIEEFIFIVDFANTDGSSPDDVPYMFMSIGCDKEYRDDNGEIAISVDNIIGPNNPQVDLKYNLIPDVTTKIVTEKGFIDEEASVGDTIVFKDTESIYVGETVNIGAKTKLQLSADNYSGAIMDSRFEDYKIGALLSIHKCQNVDANGECTSYSRLESDLFGVVVNIDGEAYYPQTKGYIRLVLAGRVTEVLSDIEIDFSNSSLSYGLYKVEIESFISYDGLYSSNVSDVVEEEINTRELEFRMVDNQYGIDVEVDPIQVTHDVETGKDINGNNTVKFKVSTRSGFENPNLRITLYRRTYDDAYDTSYKVVDMLGIADSITFNGDNANILDEQSICTAGEQVQVGYDPNTGNNIFECHTYKLGGILNTVGEDVNVYEVNFTLNNGPTDNDLSNKIDADWKSGTYKVEFAMFDGDKKIGSVYEYIIIRKLGLGEDNGGS